jgi:chitin synthase
MLPKSLPKKIALLYQLQLDALSEEGKDSAFSDYKLTTFFLNKHLNGRKLSSHMWFFEGFCRLLQPKYCALIDVGTVPHKMGLVNYFLPMEYDKHIGGVSGYMGLYFDEEARLKKK